MNVAIVHLFCWTSAFGLLRKMVFLVAASTFCCSINIVASFGLQCCSSDFYLLHLFIYVATTAMLNATWESVAVGGVLYIVHLTGM